ncbi:MAG: ATP-dependent DNA helicase RecQ, partial [Methylophaga sp.]|nr:ATP-dependent DNA helicase RecQ [Methylophaga sp.]
ISTFGIGSDMPVTEWRSLFRQLIALGYLDTDAQRHGALRLTEKCRALLRGEQTLQLRKQSKPEKTAKEKKQKNSVRPQDESLWEALRALRLRLAEEHGVPPYVIFHDATLQEMLKSRPITLAGLSKVSGVGEQKLLRYGKDFIDEIAQYPLSELLNNRLSSTVNETLICYQQGLEIEKIAQQRDVKTNTIYTHLADAIEVGLLDVRDVLDLSDAEYNEVIFVLESQEDQEKGRLKPAYDELDGEYDYGILRCVQASI